jgi:hypothetical protein
LKHKNTQPLYIFNRENPQNSEPQNGPRSRLDYIVLPFVETLDQSTNGFFMFDEQLLDLVILNRSIDCISTLYHQKNHQYLNGQQDTSTTIAYQIPNSNQNPCLNFCFHDAECIVTTLNKPVCHCQQNFTGTRCQVDVCHNYCLNNGICSASTAFETLKCQCLSGFSGSRCQLPEPETATPPQCVEL